TIATKILGDSSGPFIRSALVNAGETHGVLKGQIVINYNGLVGRIIEVGSKTSRVLLITDINSRIPIITASSRERGIVVGNNTDLLSLLYLPEDTRVQIGEIIFTSGDGESFPSGVPIGT